MSQCNNGFEIQIFVWINNAQTTVQDVYWSQTSTAEIHRRFQGYVPLSPVIVCIAMDECILDRRHIKKLNLYSFFCVIPLRLNFMCRRF
jgi:hypothetical protein